MSAEKRRKILLVEDEAVTALVTSNMLKKNGYDVIIASDGRKAVEAVFADSVIDLILMDIDLGDGPDGTEAASEILKTVIIPIVFLTSHSEKEIVESVRSITRYGYVIKNSGDFVLLSSIEMAFELFDSHRSLERAASAIRESEEMVRRKLDSIISPEGRLEFLELADIVDIPMLQNLMDDFYNVTGIGGAIIDLKGKVLIHSGWSDLCIRFHYSNPATHSRCIESNIHMTKGIAPGVFEVYKCRNGLMNMATPIMVGGRHAANIIISQFFFDDEEPDYDFFRVQAKEYGFNESEYIEALNKVSKYNRGSVYTAMDIYIKFADIISRLSYSNLKLARTLHERQVANTNYSKRDKQYRQLFEGMLSGFALHEIIVDDWGNPLDYIFLEINPAFEKQTGLVSSEITGKTVKEVLPGTEQFWIDTYGRVALTGEEISFEQFSGALQRWFKITAYSPEAGFFATIFEDITDRKKAETVLAEREKRYKQLLESVTDYVYTVYFENNYPVNTIHGPGCEAVTGFLPEDYLHDRELWHRMIYPDDRESVTSFADDISKGSNKKFIEHRLVHNDGSIKWVRNTPVHHYNENGVLCSYDSIIEDITERKIAEEQIQKLLNEKEVLLKEVHHRIKNNMNAISGLLALQGAYMDNPAAVSALEDARGRVQGMMIIYDQLYRSSDFRNVSVKEYLDKFIDEIMVIYPHKGGIKVEKEIDDFITNTKILFPLGIIINELFTNSFKYAFAGSEGGLIKFSLLKKNDSSMQMIIHDNGPGIGERKPVSGGGGFGLNLVEALTQQIDGEFEIIDDNGAKIIITVPVAD